MVGRDVIFEIEKAPAHPGGRASRCATSRVARRSRRRHGHRARLRRCGRARSSASRASRATASANWWRRSPGMRPSSPGTIEIDGKDLTGRARARSRARRRARSRRPRTSTASSARSRSPTTSCSTRYYRTPFARRRIRQLRGDRRAGGRARTRYDIRTPGSTPGSQPLRRQPAEGHHRPRALG